MSLQTRLSDLITAIGTDWKTIWANTGNKSALNTTDKASLVAAINEVNLKPTGGVSILDTDPGTSTTTTYSANKIKALNDVKATDTLVVHNTGAETIAGVKTFSSAPVVPSAAFAIDRINGLQTALDAKPVIADGSATNATATTYSANKINAAISAAVAALVGSAGSTLDTLGEIATALGNDASLSATLTTAVGNRVRYDAAQTLTAPQKVQANANMGSLSLVDAGNVDVDLVALYTTAKA